MLVETAGMAVPAAAMQPAGMDMRVAMAVMAAVVGASPDMGIPT